jgi:hypothetical protein
MQRTSLADANRGTSQSRRPPVRGEDSDCQHTTRCYAQTPRLTLILLDLMHDLVHYVTSESCPSNLSTVAFNWLIELKSNELSTPIQASMTSRTDLDDAPS